MLHLDVDQLRVKVRSWQTELETTTTRGTIVIGTVTKGLLGFEGILTEAILVMTGVLNEEGRGIYKLALGGKRLSTASLGDKRQLLVSLREHFRIGIVAKGLRCPQQLLDKTELDNISRLATLRNDFLHGKLGFNSDLPAEQAKRVASDILFFCDSPFITMALAIDRQA